jgi:hypothetical protein
MVQQTHFEQLNLTALDEYLVQLAVLGKKAPKSIKTLGREL